MKYQSTRSEECVSSTQAVLNGIAKDGSLYVYPKMSEISFDWKACLKLKTQQMSVKILSTLLDDFEDMDNLVENSYKNKFETEDLTPLVKVGDDYVLELFRGPTSAFKDVALSVLPHLINQAKKQNNSNDQTVILTATSGDTGKAALEGFHDVEGTKIIVFYPDNGVSQIQKAQMTTQSGNNVKVCAVKGNFDDCQNGVKKAFVEINTLLQNTNQKLSSANSINIGRLAPQLVYYFSAYRDLVNMGKIKVGDKVNYIVPTGNFGDILAGFYAKQLGLPVGVLVCAANINNVLTQFIRTGTYDKNRPFYKTESPSMDILISSNLERLLFMASNNDTEKTSQWMKELKEKGSFTVDSQTLAYIQNSFNTWYCTEEETTEDIGECWQKYKYLCDPHTAVAYHAAKRFHQFINPQEPCVILSTASPYKFPGAVLKGLGQKVEGDEYQQMEKIHQLTGIKIPQNLSSLKGKKVIHTDVIEKNQITEYVLKELKKWK